MPPAIRSKRRRRFRESAELAVMDSSDAVGTCGFRLPVIIINTLQMLEQT